MLSWFAVRDLTDGPGVSLAVRTGPWSGRAPVAIVAGGAALGETAVKLRLFHLHDCRPDRTLQSVASNDPLSGANPGLRGRLNRLRT